MRSSEVKRETLETKVSVKLNLDGTGRCNVYSGFAFFDHLIQTISKHSLIDLKIEAGGDLRHHIIEDVGITFGKALSEALGDKKGITRFGFAFAPMDDALARAVIDCGGRGYAIVSLKVKEDIVEDTPVEDLNHFIQSLVQSAKINIHLSVIYGKNDHHKIEAAFKALALALRGAVSLDPRRKDEVASTKGEL